MEVKKTVARVLGSMGHDALLAVPRLLEEWEKLKSDPDALKWGPDARAGPAWVFAEAIGQIDPSREEVVRVLIDTRIHTLTRSDFSFGRWHWAAVHLGNMKVRDDREICEALESVVQIDSGPARANLSWNAETNDRTALRVVAARALSKRRPSPELVRWLVESVAADANRTRRDILEAIGELGPQGEPALPYLIQIVERRRQMNSSGPACDAMLAIGRIGSAASGTVPVLMSVLDDDWGSSSYICPAIQSLGLLGESASGALVSLQAKLAHPNPEVQVAAATAIRRIGGNTSATIPVLIEGLRFDDISRPYVFPHFASWFLRARMAAQIRISAANGLAELGADAVTAMPALIRIASNDRFPTVREAAQNAALRIRARSK
jgi:hypothetical protein